MSAALSENFLSAKLFKRHVKLHDISGNCFVRTHHGQYGMRDAWLAEELR